MTVLDTLTDGVLAVALPLVAWRAIASRQLTHAVVLFVSLGLLTAIAWARLDAFDVALVEAAIGAGLTGALLMSTLPWAEAGARWSPPASLGVPARIFFALAGAAILTALGWTVLSLPTGTSALGDLVLATTGESGAAHPVTAVLLDFRGYDTLLEVAVLVVSAVGAHTLHLAAVGSAGEPEEVVGPRREGALIGVLVDLLLPVAILVAGYLVWKGASGPGGAFQASAILGGAAVLLVLSRRFAPPSLRGVAARASLLAGLALFTVVAAGPLLLGGSFLEYPRAAAGPLILAIEVALALSLGLALFLFFPRPRHLRRDPADEEGDP